MNEEDVALKKEISNLQCLPHLSLIKIFGKSYVFVSFQIGLQSLCLYYLDFYHRFTALADPAENMFKRVTYNLMLLDDISKGKIHPIQRIFHFMQILWENS